LPIKRICVDCGKVCYSKDIEPRCRKCFLNFNRKHETRYQYAREWTYIKKYDIDFIAFDCLWIAFGGKCGICDKDLTLPERKQGQKLSCAVIDHNHTTGNIRGLLGNSCNKALGLFGDDVNIVKKAVYWLNEEGNYEKDGNNS